MHVFDYWKSLGYKRENHPDWITITELLKRREALWVSHRRMLEGYR